MTLTATEFVILHALARRPGVVKSRNALMELAYDSLMDERTIYMSSLNMLLQSGILVPK